MNINIKQSLDNQAKSKHRDFILTHVMPYLTQEELLTIYYLKQDKAALNRYTTHVLLSKSFQERKQSSVKKYA